MGAPSSGQPQMLRRELGTGGAVMMGLGSILGTGVFVSIGVAAGVTGGSVVLAVLVAGLVAAANGLSSAQLAAAHPVSGGTYEYGYEFLAPAWGFTAGWMFLLAKSASAATAALGFAGYVGVIAGGDGWDLRILAMGALVVLTGVVLAGIRRSNTVNVAIVTVTLVALGLFVVVGVGSVSTESYTPWMLPERGFPGLLEATALMFVAYTGYGRIATLGEEVRRPAITIPRAIIATLVVTIVLYGVVTLVAVGLGGAEEAADATSGLAAPLAVLSERYGSSWLARVVAVGAVTAMLGVLLNLVLGLSRVAMAMGRRRDLPAGLARLNAEGTTPYAAVLAVAGLIGGLVMFGDVKTTWTFSAFTVLIYYAITNLAALRLPEDRRRFPRAVAWAGLVACAFLAWWVEPVVWAIGLALILVGLIWHAFMAKRR